MTDDKATPADVTRTIGPLEQHAIDTAPFGGLTQHYYALYLRGADVAKELEVALAAERDRADRAERDAQRSEQRFGGMAGEREAMKEQWLEMRRERDSAEARADRTEARLAKAPHSRGCILEVPPDRRARSEAWKCTCWKSEATA